MKTILLALTVLSCSSSLAFGDDLPKRELTPGSTRPGVTKDDVCAPGYTKTVRDVPSSVKARVYEIYGLAGPRAGICSGPQGCELDHLIPLDLGGSNDVNNLWPQSSDTKPWSSHAKDRLENYLFKAVCDGRIALEEAQHEISTDWIAAYRKYIGEPPQ